MSTMKSERYLLGVLSALIGIHSGAFAYAAGKPKPKPEPEPVVNIRERALAIAAVGLQNNIAKADGKEYILAGAHQFYSLWARDFAMSVSGALDLGRHKAVKDSLEILLGRQRADGVIPRQVDNVDHVTRFFFGLIGLVIEFVPPFEASFLTENKVVAIDGNAAVPWAAGLYISRTGDLEFAARWWRAAVKAIDFIERKHLQDGIVSDQPKFADWADSIARHGRVSMTQELYILALRSLSEWAGLLGKEDETIRYAEKAAAAQDAFNRNYWVEDRAMILNFEGSTHLSADTNLLAVTHQLVNPDRARRILDTMRVSPLWSPMPGRATYPDYPSSWKSPFVKLSGMGDYHDRLYWLWLTALSAQAERRIGHEAGCNRILDQLSEVLIRHKTVYEVYNLKDNKLSPVSRLLYKSEKPFSWSSGMIVHALAEGCTPPPR